MGVTKSALLFSRNSIPFLKNALFFQELPFSKPKVTIILDIL